MCRMQNCTEKYSPIVSLLHFFVFVFSCFGFRCRLFCRIRWMAAATAAATKHLRHACMHLIAIASNANCSWCTIAVLVGKQHADMPFHNVYHCFYAIILLLLLLLHFRIFFFFFFKHTYELCLDSRAIFLHCFVFLVGWIIIFMCVREV